VIVYCDTSLLVSLLNEDDANHEAARSLTQKFDAHDFVVCEVHQLELPAALRAAVHRERDAVPEHIARRVINRFDRALNSGVFLRRKLEMAETVAMVRTLGDAHGWRKRHTTLDLWHLAAAWMLSVGVFLTFDKRQAEVARILGMKTG